MDVHGCGGTCGRKAGFCPQRRNTRAETDAQLWRESGYVFTTPRGEPVNPNTDHGYWKRLLADAGLRDGRLHDARHTAAAVLLILGVPERAVMGLMVWSSTAMAARYRHVTGVVRDDVGAPAVAHETGTETERRRRAHPHEDVPALSLFTAAEDAGFEPARA